MCNYTSLHIIFQYRNIITSSLYFVAANAVLFCTTSNHLHHYSLHAPRTVGRPGSDDCLPKVYLFCYTYPFPRSDTLLMTNYLSVHEDNAK